MTPEHSATNGEYSVAMIVWWQLQDSILFLGRDAAVAQPIWSQAATHSWNARPLLWVTAVRKHARRSW